MGTWINVTTGCPLCGGLNKIRVKTTDWAEWLSGSPKYVQELFPYLSPEDREKIITGTCEACWGRMMTEDDEGEAVHTCTAHEGGQE